MMEVITLVLYPHHETVLEVQLEENYWFGVINLKVLNILETKARIRLKIPERNIKFSSRWILESYNDTPTCNFN